MLRSRPLIASLVAVVLIISLMSVTTRERESVSKIEQKVIEALAPLETGLHGISGWIEDRVQAVAEIGRLKADNARLRTQLERSQALETEYWQLRSENERLKALLSFTQSTPDKTVPAQVIARNADNWFNSITINRGTDQGLAKDMPVTNSAGVVVGRIVKVTQHTSTVMLLIDPASGVGGMVQRTDFAGIVVGETDASTGLVINLFDSTADIMVGDTIVTSGLGGTFPKGMLIGQVEKVSLNEYGLYRTAVVKPAADFGRLQEVVVLIPNASAQQGGGGQ